MKNKSLILIIISVFLLLVSCSSNNVTVFGNGQTGYAIITAEGASDEALEIANSLADLSGANPEIYTDASAETSFEILIGDTNRAATKALVGGLQEVATVSAFHYIVAEDGGKIVILSDADIGYIYALDYIKATYLKDGVLSIPRGTYELKQVVWDDYYASDLYFDRITAEADKNRYEQEKDQLENEMNRYDENKGNNILTVEQAIEQYKNLAANFKTEDFGDYNPATFISANTYRVPTVYPGESHPRVLFTENTVEKVRENILSNQSYNAYQKYITLSDVPCDGKFKDVTGSMVQNYDSSLSAQIEAKAFRYAMERDPVKYPNPNEDPAALYGYEAIYAAKNAMLTINVPHTVGDWCRTYGHLMYVVSCVYDWCYDLLTEADKTQIVNGGVILLGKHFEIVCYSGPGGDQVPTKQGAMYGHGAEDQLLVDYLAFAIAVYNENPEIYELVAGRILNDYVEAQNYLFQSGGPWEGSMYGSVRGVATMVSNVLFNKMTDGEVTPFENLEKAIETTTQYIRPDGQVYRIGDINENNTAYQFVWFANNCFYAGNLYENEYLKSYAYEYLRNFNYFSNMVAGLSVVQFLAINDPDVSRLYKGDAPLTWNTTYPGTSLFAKSAADDKNAFGIYMSMPENYAASHNHKEAGSFQIFYKGALATDSGAYDSWGGDHHMGYNMQTISSNSLLIYNPALKDYKDPNRTKMVYSGGQAISNGAALPDTLAQLKASGGYKQVTTLGLANVERNGQYLYSYLGGDMTKAYDDVTVDEVTRYMFAFATGNSECPLVFMTFDRITSDDASFRKSALIHTQQAPTILGDYFAFTDSTGDTLTEVKSSTGDTDNYAIIINGEGKLIVQSVGYDTEYTVVGGEGKEFWIPGVDENGNYSIEDGRNLPQGNNIVAGSLEEYGWGRIEISPAQAAKTNYMLSVMYVTDASNNKAPVKAAEIMSENLSGAQIFGKAVIFPKNEKLLTEESSFTVSSSGECFIAGMSAGTWSLMKDGAEIATFEVADGTNLASFNLTAAGTYTIKPAN